MYTHICPQSNCGTVIRDKYKSAHDISACVGVEQKSLVYFHFVRFEIKFLPSLPTEVVAPKHQQQNY